VGSWIWSGGVVTFDVVIRNGTIIDGSGWPRYRADVGVRGGRIAKIGRITERGAQDIDAEGHFVTPGFVDSHTHLDAQICWDPLGPAAVHGVTSSIMGNCGISLAPCHDDERERDIFARRAMAVAEDIPRKTVDAAVPWAWETFADYMDFIGRRPKGINFGAQVGHGALRTYVLGERAFEKDAATDDEIAAMARELESAFEAGALGFTTMLESSIFWAPFPDGADIRDVDPRAICAQASTREVDALVDVFARAGRGSLQMWAPWETAVHASAKSGLPVQFMYGVFDPEVAGRRIGVPGYSLQSYDEAAERGAQMIAVIPPRSQTSVLGFRVRLPFDALPLWSELRSRPLAEQRTALTDPSQREQLLHVARTGTLPGQPGMVARPPNWATMQILDRALPPYRTVGQVAAERGQDPYEVFLDLAMANDFDRLFAQPLTHNPDRATWLEMFRHPRSVISLADTGAHTSQACDWCAPTYFLGHWVRNEQEFTWEEGVRLFTFDPASVWGGLGGRGLVREGFVADLNVFDPETIAPDLPFVADDLPAGGVRLLSLPIGIKATVVNGQLVFEDGKHTGALPGQVLTGAAPWGTGEHG
jgi:N-acyl-D-amino-acid deacylase